MGEMSIGTLITWIWKRRKTFLIVEVVAVVCAVVVTLLSTPYYKATTSLLPQDEQQMPGFLNKLQMLLGMNILGATNNEELYGKIIASDTVLNELLDMHWQYQTDSEPVDLLPFSRSRGMAQNRRTS